MVSKTDLALIAVAGVGLFIVARQLGGFFSSLNIGEQLGGVGASIGSGLGDLGQQLTEAVAGAGEALGGATQSAGESAQQVASSIPSGSDQPIPIIDPLGAGLGGAFAGIGSFFSNLFGGGEPQPQTSTQEAILPQATQEAINFAQRQTTPGGLSFAPGQFVGGSITETPIERLSLSQIIDRFPDITASQASNLRAIARDDFPPEFDFGTNTGRGIGSILQDPGISSQLPGGNVSTPEFEGLSAEEIARRLTGGNISNF